MKIRTFALYSAAALAASSAAAFAQETVVTTPATTTAVTTADAGAESTTTTTTSNTAGSITEFSPTSSRIVVRPVSGAPVTYTYSRQTMFVDDAGNVVAAASIRPGTPTTVYYTMENDQPVVSRIVVNRTVQASAPATHTETTETTTTTTSKK